MVCMWRKESMARPVQSVQLRRSILAVESIQCLVIWRTTYSLDLLAACVELDDTQVRSAGGAEDPRDRLHESDPVNKKGLSRSLEGLP